MSPKFFPVVMAVLDLIASVVYLAHKDWRHSLYWLAAAVLTGTVTTWT